MKKINQQVIDKVLQKIEDELDDISVESAMEYSGYSYYHFHRLFFVHVGESLKQYIKRLRLERAAMELNYKKISITQVALSAGFQTPSAFNKAFKDFFHVNPSEYKKINLRPKEYEMIEPIRTEAIEPIKVYSLRHVGDYNKIGEKFEVLMKFAYTQKMKHGKKLLEGDWYSYGMYYDDPNVTEIDKLRSDACIENTDESVVLEDGIEKRVLEGGKYAVFLHKGEYGKLKDTYNAIFSSYIKERDITLRDTPTFEKYLDKDCRRTKPENLRTEIYIPIA